jgi:8-oxo-dGTP diphosphatase
MAEREIGVAAAVIEHPDGRFLLAQRPPGKVYAGYWEFPGGKIEPGETAEAALRRELDEELGIDVVESLPWLTRVFTYPHATVRLHFRRVVAWKGEPHPHEGQALAWQRSDALRSGDLDVEPMLPANAPVLKALSLPLVLGITRAWQVGVARALEELDGAIAAGLRLVQVREAALSGAERGAFAAQVVSRMHAAGGLVLVNSDEALARAAGADGVHLPARQLAAIAARPHFAWVGASCHDATELAQVEALGLDFALAGPVKPTPTHPESRVLGWEGFERLVRGATVPVYALGGLERADLRDARCRGAHGLAMIRGAWSSP